MNGSLGVRIFRWGFSTSAIDVPVATLGAWLASILTGGGGSAIPCGLAFPAANAKLNDGEAEPLVRVVAESN